MGTIYGREPVLVYMIVQAAITLAVTFGLRLTVEQIGGFLTLTLAILSFVVRGVVTPVNAPKLPLGSPVTTLTGLSGEVTLK